ncbi:MAG: DUF4381 domain-containing protein [Gammaproteobacteria bacterium]|nr:DUF4381 domain-containing protein [Gammaproteobacteria bacterium]
MNPVSELLAGLRDIHLPAAVSWWPPAPLWWWSLAALAVAAALSVAAAVVLRRRRERAATLSACRLALRELGVLRRRFFAGGNARDLLAGLSVLLRRTAISLSPRAETAALTGDAWLAWLDARAGRELFSRGAARAIANAPYRPSADADARAVLIACEEWLTLMSQDEEPPDNALAPRRARRRNVMPQDEEPRR